jgi:hypothetical protein
LPTARHGTFSGSKRPRGSRVPTPGNKGAEMRGSALDASPACSPAGEAASTPSAAANPRVLACIRNVAFAYARQAAARSVKLWRLEILGPIDG